MDHALRRINERSEAGIAYDVTGRGPAVLFLHGLTFDRRTWTPIISLTGDRVLSLVVDLPGHGGSAAWSAYDFDTVIDALHDTVKEVGVSEPVVVGHSISGLLGFVYAARYPTSAVIDVDMVLDLRGFAELVRSLGSQLHGPGVRATLGAIRTQHATQPYSSPRRGNSSTNPDAPTSNSYSAIGHRCSIRRLPNCWTASTRRSRRFPSRVP